MLSVGQKSRAYLCYMALPMRRFAPLLLVLILVLLVGGVAFQQLYTETSLSFPRALYITYALIFMEHLLPFPQHWLLRLFYVLLPPLGLAVILDGIVQFSMHILRRDKAGQEWNLAMLQTLDNHIIVLGLGKAGLRVLQYLLQLGEQVAVLEKNPACPNLSFAHMHGVPVIIGDHRQAGVLNQLNIAAARALVLATDNDLANIELALDARKLRPDINVVLRVFDQELATKIRDSFKIPNAYSTTTLAAPLFACSALDSSIINAFDLDGHLLVVSRVEMETDSILVGEFVSGIAAAHRCHVLAVQRREVLLIPPSPSCVVEIGDTLTLQAELEDLRALQLCSGIKNGVAAQ